MQNYINKLNENICKKILTIETEEGNDLQKLEKIIRCIRFQINELKNFMAKYKFKNKNEEILFFKELKPQVTGKLIYYAEIFRIESKKSFCSDQSTEKYLNDKLEKIKQFFNDNIKFYQYYLLKSTFQDDIYFLRNLESLFFNLDNNNLFSDLAFSTSHDHLVAEFIAYDLLNKYLRSELAKLKKPDSNHNPNDRIFNSNIQWTDTKVAMVELIYALHFSGSLNNGKAELKELVSFFETIFNIRLNDFYRIYMDIRLRSNPAKYLDHLKDSLIRHIQMEDSFPSNY